MFRKSLTSHQSQGVRRRRLARAGLYLAIGALGATAFAGVAGASVKPASHPASKNIPIVMGMAVTGQNWMPIYVAVANNYFQQAGLNASYITISGGDPTNMAAFINGNINMISGGVADVLEYISNGVLTPTSGKFISELVGPGYDIDTNKSITSMSQLPGKIVGISAPTGGDQVYVEAVLQAYGIPENSVTYLTVGGAAARLAALQNNIVQVIAQTTSQRAAIAAFGNILLPSSATKVPYPNTLNYASKALLKHPAELTKFVNVLDKSTKWIRTHEIAATPLCVTITASTTAVCQGAIQDLFDRTFGGKYTWSNTGAIDTKGVATALKIVKGLFPSAALSKVTLKSIVDTSIAGTKV